jgi:hypothetical protein
VANSTKWVWLGLLLGAAACAPPRPAKQPPKPKLEEPRTQNVYVTIDVDRPAAKLVFVDRKGAESPVCDAPCNRVVPVIEGYRYHVELPESMPTRTFALFSPEDPVAWIDVKAQPKSTHDAIHAVFIACAVGGLILGLGAATAVPFVPDEARVPVSAVAAAGTVLALPISTILGVVGMQYSESDMRFRNPRERQDLRARFR